MSSDTTRIGTLAALGLVGWLAPLGINSKALQGFSLATGLICQAAACIQSKRAIVSEGVRLAARDNEAELIAHEMSYSHEAELERLRSRYFPAPQPVLPDRNYPYPLPTPQPQLNGGHIGQNMIASSPVAPMATATAGNSEPSAIDRLLSSPWVSRCVFGAQRSGKTMLVSTFTKALAARTYHINLGSFGGEDKEYWNHAQSITANLTALSEAQAGAIIGDCITLVQHFAGDSQAVLVIDEWSITASTFHRHKALLEPLAGLIAAIGSDLVANGVKRSQALYLLAPEMVAGKLSEPGKIIKSLALVLAGVSPAKTVMWNGNKVSFSQELYSQIKANFPACPALPSPGDRVLSGDRICSVDGAWFGIPDFGAVPTIAAGNVSAAPAVAPVADTAPSPATNTAPATDTAALERALATGPSDLHWKAIEFCLSRGGWVSLRDIQRGVGLPTADVARGLVGELVSLELGELTHDPKYDRYLFRAFEPSFDDD